MKRLVAACLFVLITSTLALGAEEKIGIGIGGDYPTDGRYCSNESRKQAVQRGEKMDPYGGPFRSFGLFVAGTVFRAYICGQDHEKLISLVRQYYRYYGCDESSQIGQLVERQLTSLPPDRETVMTNLQETMPDYDKICADAQGCVIPETFNQETFIKDFQCRVTIFRNTQGMPNQRNK